MPAHVPRRKFAKPFIITIAATTATAACQATVHDNPPAHNPPAQDTAVPSATAQTQTQPQPQAPATADRSWTLQRSDKGVCTAEENGVASAYVCPSNVTRFPSTITLAKGETECHVRVFSDMSCPPHAFCNPPPPHDVVVSCPK